MITDLKFDYVTETSRHVFSCAIDKYILPDINYEQASPTKAWVEGHVFKYADKPTVFFQCVLQLCNRGEKQCESVTVSRPDAFQK